MHRISPLSSSRCPEIDACLDRAFTYLGEGGDEDSSREFAQGWGLIRDRLTPAMTSLQDITHSLGSVTYPEDALHEYIMLTSNLAHRRQEEATVGIEFCEFALRQFTAEDELFQENMQGYLGRLYFLAGDPASGQKILQTLISDRPHRAIGYAYLSDCLASNNDTGRQVGPSGLPQAIDLLRQALALPVEDAGDYDLKSRLQDFEDMALRS